MFRTVLIFFVALSPLLSQDPPAKPAVRRVTLMLEQAFGNEWRQVDPHTVFKANDEIRFRFRANFDGFLYALNETSAGENLWLFPTAETGIQNHIAANREYMVPATAGSFVIPRTGGYDIVYWIVSPVSFSGLPEMPSRSKQFPQHSYTPLLPRCKESTLKARGLCLDGQAGAGAVTDSSRLPPALAPERPLKSRDLDFHEDSGQSRISAAGLESGPFIYQFRIAHQ